MKGDPEDLRKLAEDLKWCIRKHPDAIQNNPDIAKDIVNARDKADAKFRQVTEGRYPRKLEDYE